MKYWLILLTLFLSACVLTQTESNFCYINDSDCIEGNNSIQNITTNNNLTNIQKITTNNANQFYIKAKAGKLIKINLSINNPENKSLTILYGKPLNLTGEWQTNNSDIGTYNIPIIIKYDEEKIIQNLVLKIINENQAPIIKDISPINIKTGETLIIKPEITDPENDNFTTSYSGWISKLPHKIKSEDKGTHIITLTATDDNNKSSSINITINIEQKDNQIKIYNINLE